MSLLQVARSKSGGAARRAFGSSPVRSMAGVLKVPERNPFPAMNYAPDQVFKERPPTSEQLEQYRNHVAYANELHKKFYRPATEINFDAMLEKTKDPHSFFPTVEDVDRMEKFLRKYHKMPFKNPDSASVEAYNEGLKRTYEKQKEEYQLLLKTSKVLEGFQKSQKKLYEKISKNMTSANEIWELFYDDLPKSKDFFMTDMEPLDIQDIVRNNFKKYVEQNHADAELDEGMVEAMFADLKTYAETQGGAAAK